MIPHTQVAREQIRRLLNSGRYTDKRPFDPDYIRIYELGQDVKLGLTFVSASVEGYTAHAFAKLSPKDTFNAQIGVEVAAARVAKKIAAQWLADNPPVDFVWVPVSESLYHRATGLDVSHRYPNYGPTYGGVHAL